MAKPHPAYVGARLSYEAHTGKLYWKQYEPMGKSWNTRYAGTEAFTTYDDEGYLTGKIDAKRYRAHIIAWVVYWGVWPSKQIDHADHVRDNNRMDNMNLATYTDQRRNQSSRGGCLGVFWEASRGKWKATIKQEGKTINLGRYDEWVDAVAARKTAELALGYHVNHGS